MKFKKAGVLVSAIASTAVCASLIAGSTFALFSSSDKVDITVSSGKVSVVSEVKNAQLTHAATVSEKEATYEGVTPEAVTAGDDGLSLEGIIPGDKVEFDLLLTNAGSVKTKYQYALNYTTGVSLLSAFEVEITDKSTKANVYSGNRLKSYRSAWGELVKKDDTAEYHVTLTLPGSVGNNYQDIKANLEVSTYALQYNAKIENTEAVVETVPENATVYDVSTADALQDAMNAENAYVVLNGNMALAASKNITNNLALDLNGNSLNLNKKSLNPSGADAELTLKNGMIKATTAKNNASIVKATLGAKTVLDGVTIEPEDGKHWGSMGYGVTCFDNSELIIKNSTIRGGVAVATNGSSTTSLESNIVIEDSVIEGFSAGLLFNVPGTLTIKNSTISGINQALFLRAGIATIIDSHLYNTLDYRGTGTKLNPGAADFNAYYGTSEGNFGEGHTGTQNIPLSTLVVGCASSGYDKTAKATLTNTVVENTFPAKGSDDVEWKVYGVLVWGHSEGNATVEYDAQCKITSNLTLNGGMFQAI